MVMTLPERRQGLRSIAEDLGRYEGYRVEVIGGVLVMSPSPRLKHARILRMIYDQISGRLPEGLVAAWGESVTSPEMDDDYVEPDLMVYPERFEDTDEWSVPADEVELVVEVVSVSNASRDTIDKLEWYAKVRIPLYWLIDPRKGVWRLYSAPADGRYHAVRDGKFGDEVPLPEPFGFTVATNEFKRYG